MAAGRRGAEHPIVEASKPLTHRHIDIVGRNWRTRSGTARSPAPGLSAWTCRSPAPSPRYRPIVADLRLIARDRVDPLSDDETVALGRLLAAYSQRGRISYPDAER